MSRLGVTGVRELRDLGGYLREQRQHAQLSVRQLSKAAGISNPYLSQIERGLRRASAEILQALAKGLEISAESLYVQAGLLDVPETPVAGDEGSGGAPDARVAIGADPRLTARQRRLLLDLFDSFVSPEDEVGAVDAVEPESLVGAPAPVASGPGDDSSYPPLTPVEP